MKKFLTESCDRIATVLIVLLFCQFPLYIQQYQMHLAGHKEECKLFVEWLQKDAKRSEKSLPVYIAKFLNQTDEDFVSTGKLMQKTCERYEKLTFAYNSLEQSSLLKRPFVFLQHADWEIVKETFRGFIPGFSFSIESFLYAMVAFFLWSLIWHFIYKKKNTGQ